MRRSDEEFVQHIKARLQCEAEPLAAGLQQRLDLMRQAAVKAASANMQDSTTDEQALAPLQQALRDAEGLPADLQQRLDRSREQALVRAKAKRVAPVNSWWRGLLGKASSMGRPGSIAFGSAYTGWATACVTVTVATALWFSAADPEQLPLAQDAGLLAAADELELYENLDFYLWLEENELLN